MSPRLKRRVRWVRETGLLISSSKNLWKKKPANQNYFSPTGTKPKLSTTYGEWFYLLRISKQMPWHKFIFELKDIFVIFLHYICDEKWWKCCKNTQIGRFWAFFLKMAYILEHFLALHCALDKKLLGRAVLVHLQYA